MTHKPKIVQIDYGADAFGIRGAMAAQTHLRGKKLFFAKHHYLTFVVSDTIKTSLIKYSWPFVTELNSGVQDRICVVMSNACVNTAVFDSSW